MTRTTAEQLRRLQSLRHRHSPLATHHRYSRFVRVMKILLPSLAAVLLGLVVAWPRLAVEDERFHVGWANLSPKSVESLAMVNARYFGIDESNHPFTITSKKAVQVDSQSGIVELAEPQADFTSRDGSAVFVQADRGYYHQKEQLLDLAGSVSLYHEKGYELHTEAAYIDLKAQTARGDVAVDGQGPQGRVEGEGFEIRDKGGDVMVTGRSTLVLRGASGGAAVPMAGKGKR